MNTGYNTAVKLLLSAFAVIMHLYSISSVGQERLAVLIANQNYQYQQNLVTPINEIDSIASILQGFGFHNLVFHDANYDDFKLIFDSVESQIHDSQLFYFHYAGHGVQVEGQNYFVPTDAYPNSEAQLKRQSFPMENIFAILREKSYRNSGDFYSIICLDACRNNPFLMDNFYLRPGLAEYNTNLQNTAVIFSTAAGKTAPDGIEDFSPFAGVWINRLKTNDNSILDICSMLAGDMAKLGIPKDRYPFINFSGLSDVFLGKRVVNATGNPNLSKLINSLFQGALLDKEFGRFELSLEKLALADSIVKLYPDISISEKMAFHLEFSKAECLMNLGSYESSIELLESLWDAITRQNSSGQINEGQLKSVYYLLYHELTLTQTKPALLNDVRIWYLDYCRLNDLHLEQINTLDKIAGDFERKRNSSLTMLDSAITYYEKAVDLFNKQPLSRQLVIEAGHVLSNYGNALKLKKDVNTSLKYLQKAQDLNHLYDLTRLSTIADLIDYYAFHNYSIDSVKKYVSLARVMSNLASVNESDTLVDVNLDYDFISELESINYEAHVLSGNQYNIRDAYKQLCNVAASNTVPKIELEINEKRYCQSCKVETLSLKIEVNRRFAPVLYFDNNDNGRLDSSDKVLSIKLRYENQLTAYKVSELTEISPDQVQLNMYLEEKKIRPQRTVVMNNEFTNYRDMTQSNPILGSDVVVSESGRLEMGYDISLPINALDFDGTIPNYYLGLMDPLTENIFVYPLEDGINYIHPLD